MITINIKYEAPRRDPTELISDVNRKTLIELEHLFYRELKKTTEKYLNHTILHGWNYTKTGSLYRSFRTVERKFEINKATAVISSKHPAAGILQTGGTIRPRTKKALTVPLSSASHYGFSLEMQKNLIKSGQLIKIGNKLCINIAGAKIPIAVLASSVRIPPYKYLDRIMNKILSHR